MTPPSFRLAATLVLVVGWVMLGFYDKDIAGLVTGTVASFVGLIAILRRQFVLKGLHSRKPAKVYEGSEAVLLGLLWVVLGIVLMVFAMSRIWR